MTRPSPRMSALSTSVVAPLNGTPQIASTAGANGNTGNASAFTKLTVRVPAELADEVRAAFWHTSAHTRTRSLSAWVTEALEAKLEHDRDVFNSGMRFDSLTAGSIPTGRRA